MGYWKNWRVRIGGGVHEPYKNDYVCADCFGDDALKNFVEANAAEKTCTFCGDQKDNPIAAPFLEVIVHIYDCLAREYDAAENNLSYEGKEGGYQGTVWDTFELLTDEIELELPNDDGKLLDAIINALGDRVWCNAQPYSLSDSDRLVMSWEQFCELIKYQRRFFFLDQQHDPNDELHSSGTILHSIRSWCIRLDLVASLPAGTTVFRARYQKPGKVLTTSRDLGPPPRKESTQSNRMSPPGIVMLYASDNPETALRETCCGPGKFVVGEFETCREVRILDLATLPSVPSIFRELQDTLDYDSRAPLIFLHEVTADISKSIARDDRVHVEYVPTQVITEYFRTTFCDTSAQIMGIRYPSSRHSGNNSIVLFVTQDDLIVEDEEPDCYRTERPWLAFKDIRRYEVLRFEPVFFEVARSRDSNATGRRGDDSAN